MAEKPDSLPQEIMEAENFINELLSDTKHPVHNRAHPLHQDSVNALNNMMQRLDAMRDEWLSKH